MTGASRPESLRGHATAGHATAGRAAPIRFGYCTEFVIDESAVSDEEARGRFSSLGDSLVVAGGEGSVRVHLHTPDPGAALSLAVRLGSVRDISVRNMDDQHEHAAETLPSAGTLAFADGAGFASIYESLGATVRACHPSDADSIRVAVEQALSASASSETIVVPGGREIAGAVLRQARERGVSPFVVDACDPPSSVAALMAYTYGAPIHRNLELMNAAARSVVVIGAGSPEEADSLVKAVSSRGRRFELAAVYHGRTRDEREAGRVARSVAEAARLADCEVVFGGQAEPRFLISLE